jgi:hypothetical protein
VRRDNSISTLARWPEAHARQIVVDHQCDLVISGLTWDVRAVLLRKSNLLFVISSSTDEPDAQV